MSKEYNKKLKKEFANCQKRMKKMPISKMYKKWEKESSAEEKLLAIGYFNRGDIRGVFERNNQYALVTNDGRVINLSLVEFDNN